MKPWLLSGPRHKGFTTMRTLAVVIVVVVVVVEKGFPSKRYHAVRVCGKNRERWGWFAE